MTTETKTKKTYLVTKKMMIEVEIQVDANSPEDAQARAYEWNPNGGDWTEYRSYTSYVDDEDGELIFDDGDLFSTILNWECEEHVGEPEELKDEEEDNHAQNG